MPVEVEQTVVESITIITNLRESLSYLHLSNSDTTFILFFTLCRPMFSLLIHGQQYWANDKLLKVISCFCSSCHPGLWKWWFLVTAACARRPWMNWLLVILLLRGSFLAQWSQQEHECWTETCFTLALLSPIQLGLLFNIGYGFATLMLHLMKVSVLTPTKKS